MPTIVTPGISCGRCNGKGYTEEVVRGNCPVCRGRGKDQLRQSCKRCGGYGITCYVDKVRCTTCRGRGYVG